MDRWKGKVAVVTGASAGIGAAIVKKFVENGLIVVGLARRVDKIRELADEDSELKGALHAMECDISNEESVVSAFAWINDNLGSVDILVNNAGITKETTLSEGSVEEWRSVLDVNILGLCICTREALRSMRDKNTDSLIIHINSLAGDKIPPVPGFNIYPATKRAVTALAQTLRHELAGSKIRVSSISPGLVATELMSNYSVFSPEGLASMPALQASDVAEAAWFILSLPSHVLIQDIVIRPVGEYW